MTLYVETTLCSEIVSLFTRSKTSVGRTEHPLEESESDPTLKLYQHMVKYQYEMNLANFVLNLHCKYNLSLNDQNIKVKSFVNEKIRSYAFDTLVIQCQLNGKTNQLNSKKFCQQWYTAEYDPEIARFILKQKQGDRFLLLSVLEMMNCIKRHKLFPMDWKKMSLQTVLKKNRMNL